MIRFEVAKMAAGCVFERTIDFVKGAVTMNKTKFNWYHVKGWVLASACGLSSMIGQGFVLDEVVWAKNRGDAIEEAIAHHVLPAFFQVDPRSFSGTVTIMEGNGIWKSARNSGKERII